MPGNALGPGNAKIKQATCPLATWISYSMKSLIKKQPKNVSVSHDSAKKEN